LPDPGRGANEHSIKEEFARTAPAFGRRTQGRFDHMGVVVFARVAPGATVVEVGAGTGNFLALFGRSAGRLVAVDLTLEMLREARARHVGMQLVAADGARLPLRSRSAELVASAQVLHHVARPVPFLAEMRRLVAPGGRVLIVDQLGSDRYEEATAMTELETLRDPTHASSRPRPVFHTILAAAGLRVMDERIVSSEQRLSQWMWPDEFPPERIEAVRSFIERRGGETGMGFEPAGDDYVFERRRIMLLAERA
jgi:ubiquinone/menaquinone biosynthesis C-methylase UbiE